MTQSEAEVLMEHHLRELFGDGSRVIAAELAFHPKRKWRFDYAVPELHLAVEIEGGIWSGGRHTRGQGFQGDLDKYNAAALCGWTVFRFSTEDVMQGRDLECLRAWRDRANPRTVVTARAVEG